MHLEKLLTICDEFSKLHWAVRDQFLAVTVDDEDLEDQNPDALKQIIQFLDWLDGESIRGAKTESDKLTNHLKEHHAADR